MFNICMKTSFGDIANSWTVRQRTSELEREGGREEDYLLSLLVCPSGLNFRASMATWCTSRTTVRLVRHCWEGFRMVAAPDVYLSAESLLVSACGIVSGSPGGRAILHGLLSPWIQGCLCLGTVASRKIWNTCINYEWCACVSNTCVFLIGLFHFRCPTESWGEKGMSVQLHGCRRTAHGWRGTEWPWDEWCTL